MNVACFIPSKGRPHTRAYRFFETINVPVFHVVEPQNLEQYQANGLACLVLPSNNKGLVFSRNWILGEAKRRNLDIAFMCDDDIASFGKMVAGKCVNDGSALGAMLETLRRNTKVVVGLEYRQRAWRHTKTHYINRSWLDVCIAFRPTEITAWYDPELVMKEDRDWVLQNIANGMTCVRLNNFFFSVPNIGTNGGGLDTLYQKKHDSVAAQRFVKKWKPFLQLVKKGDRLDAKANWNLIKRFLPPQ